MRKNTFISVVFLFFCLIIPFSSHAQTPDWTRLLQLNTNSAPFVNVVTADASKVYMAARFSGSLTFDGGNYSSIGLNDMLLIKMSNTGVTEWVRQFSPETGGSISPNAIKVDTNGNILVSASFSGTISIGGNPVTSSTSINSIFAMFDASGKRIWATPLFSSGTGSSKIAFDSSGNSYLISRTSKLLKFNSSGTILWEQQFTDRTLQAIAVYGSNLYLGGALQDNITHFGTIDLTMVGGYNTGFLVKADLNGVYSKGIVVGGSTTGDGSTVCDIVPDKNGNLIITGCYTKNLVLGGITISNPTQSYFTYIAKCDNNLDFAWAKSSSGFSNPNRILWTYRVFLDDANNIYELGMISSSITFGAVTITPNSGNQFLYKFDANGNTTNGYILQNAYNDLTIVNQLGKILIGKNSGGNFFIAQFSNGIIQDWEKGSTGSPSGSATINYIKHDAAGNTYLQARINGYCNYFGTDINTYATVISKHDITGKLLWMNQIADISPDVFGPAFILDKDNNILTVGLFKTSLTIGTTTLNSSNSGNEGYVAKYSSSGVFLWAAKMSLNANVTSSITVASDNAGNVLVSGVIDPANYIVKFDASGNQLWAKSFPMESHYLSLISTDANNNIYLTSEIHLSDGSGSTTIGSVPLTQTKTDGSTALIKFDPNGNALWAKTYGGVAGGSNSDGWPCDMKTDAAGNTFLWGWCLNKAVFGANTLTNPIGTGYSLYLAKVNTSGDVVWAKAVYQTKSGYNYGDLLDLDKNGNVYVGGHFTDRIRIESTEYVPEGTNDFFVVKYSGTGIYQWIKTIPANSNIIKALSVKDNNIVSVAGAVGKGSTLGGLNYQKTSGSNGMVATLGNYTGGNPSTSVAADYFLPLCVGNYIKLNTTGNDGRTTYYRIVKAETINNETYYAYRGSEIMNNNPVEENFNYSWLRKDAAGNILIGAFDPTGNGNLSSAIFNLPLGGVFFPNQFLTKGYSRSYVWGNELQTESVVSVSATVGIYTNCIQIRNTVESGGIIQRIDDSYYAYKVGLIKEERVFPTEEARVANMVDFNSTNCYTTGTSEGIVNEREVSIYPNPSIQTLYISGLTQNSKISIFDLSGKLLIDNQIVNDQIDIRHLINGIYILRISDKNGITMKKFVKQ